MTFWFLDDDSPTKDKEEAYFNLGDVISDFVCPEVPVVHTAQTFIFDSKSKGGTFGPVNIKTAIALMKPIPKFAYEVLTIHAIQSRR